MKNSDYLIGTVIDARYRIDALIARGGMASVYRADDLRLERPVALKLIHPHLAEQDNFTARFIREARAAASLNDPYIVAVHDQGVAHTPEGERAYLVMELVNGPNLRSELNRLGSLTLGQTLSLIEQILHALAAAHKAGIVHRDVKPENILLSAPLRPGSVHAQETAKVADFGLAHAAGSLSAGTSAVLGTVAYLAPEILSGRRADAAADIYSVGIMAYELLAGELPYPGTSAFSLAYAHLNRQIPRIGEKLEWIPEEIDSLISLFTAKNTAERPANAQEALKILRHAESMISPELLLRRLPIFPPKANTLPTQVQPSSAEAPTETKNTPAAGEQPAYTADLHPQPAVTEILATAPGTSLPERHSAARMAQTAEKQKKKRKHRSRRLPIFLLPLLILAALCASGGYWWFEYGPGMRLQVTDVAGKTSAAAAAQLKKAGFTAVETQYAFSDTVAKDIAIGTDPKAGSKIHPSAKLRLLISRGVEYLQVPDLVNLNADEAQKLLGKSRFRARQREDWSETAEKGKVISQQPAAGTSAVHDSEVLFTVSKGRKPILVPDVTGMAETEARAALEAQSLRVSETETYSDTVEKGRIISLSPGAGTTLHANDTVTLTVSKGKTPVPVPNVVGRQLGEAVKILKDAGFNVDVQKILGGLFKTVRLQNPAGGEKLQPGSTVSLTVV